MDKKTMGLLSNLNPVLARQLDEQERQRRLQARVAPTNYGNDAMGRFLTAWSGAARSAGAGGEQLGRSVMGVKPVKGMYTEMYETQKEKEEEEKKKELQLIETEKANATDILYNTSALGEQTVSTLLKAVERDPTGKVAKQVIDKYGLPDLPEKDDKVDYTKYITTLVNNKSVTGKSATKALMSGSLKDLEYVDPEKDDKEPKINLISDFVDVDLDNYTDESIASANAALLDANKDNFTDKITEARGKLIRKAPIDETDYIAFEDEIKGYRVEFDRLDRLAYDVEKKVQGGGKLAEGKELIKSIFGVQDVESALRKAFIKEKNTEMLAYLPPGIASDKDVALVLQGLPDDFTNPAQMASYLRGLAKLKREEQRYTEFKRDYLKENKGDATGLSSALNKKALSEYNTAYEGILKTSPTYKATYNRAVELAKEGMDSLDLRNQIRDKVFEVGGANPMRNAQIIIKKLELEGILK